MLTTHPRRTLLAALILVLVAGVLDGPVAGALKDDGAFAPSDAGLPLLLLLSIAFFRERAAWLPVAVGLSTILGTFTALRVANEAYGLSVFALNLVIGLAYENELVQPGRRHGR